MIQFIFLSFITPIPLRRHLTYDILISRGKKRPHGYVHKTPLPKSPADIMRSAYKLTKKILSTTTIHHRLRRLLVICQRWLQKASPPPGALIMQKRNVLAQYISVNGVRGLRPVSPPWWCVYAIVNLKSGRSYVGRTRRSPYLQFQEHVEKDTDQFGRALRNNPKDFVVIQLEKVPKGTKLEDFRRRESSWINRVDALSIGYNSRREIIKRPAPFLPVYGLGPD